MDSARTPQRITRARTAPPRTDAPIDYLSVEGRHSGRASFTELDGLPASISDRVLISQQLLLDPRVLQLRNRRADAIAARRLKIEPPTGGRRKNWERQISELWTVFEDSGYENMVDDLFREALLPGFSVAVINPWNEGKGKVRSLDPWQDQDGLKKFHYEILGQQWFQFVRAKDDDKTPVAGDDRPYDPFIHKIVKFRGLELRFMVPGYANGLRCPNHRFILFSMSRISPLAGGLAPVLWALTEFQETIKNAARAIACRAESPPVIGTYPATLDINVTADADLLTAFQQFLEAASRYNYGMFPEGFAVQGMAELAEFEPEQQRYWMDWCDRMKMIAVLGEVSASEMEFGSRALAESIVDDRNSTTVDRDADWRDGQLREFNRRLFATPESLNGERFLLVTDDRFIGLQVSTEKASDLRQAEVKQEEEAIAKSMAERQSIQADLLKKMIEAGYQPSADWVAENLGDQWSIPIADPNAENVTQTALRGTQIESMLTIVDAVKKGSLDREGAIALLLVAFPIDRPTAEKILPQETMPEPQPEPLPLPADPVAPPPQFAAKIELPSSDGGLTDEEWDLRAIVSAEDRERAIADLEEEG